MSTYICDCGAHYSHPDQLISCATHGHGVRSAERSTAHVEADKSTGDRNPRDGELVTAGRDRHTPGPWRLKASPYEDGTPYFHIYAGDGWFGRLDDEPEGTTHGFELTGIMLEADARLIAASPDLLAALKALLPEIDAEIEERQHGGNAEVWEPLQKLSDAAHAAVRKAEGRANG